MKPINFISFLIAVLSSCVAYGLLIFIRYVSNETIAFSDQAFAIISGISFLAVFSLLCFHRFGWLLVKKLFQSEIDRLLKRNNKTTIREA